ncbi:MAG: hydrogenase nickel incorporation protein HypB [Bacteroidales bacterium]|nr:hydrogenase nickel incorporation protein HypB [Bacteroidales bacterium]
MCGTCGCGQPDPVNIRKPGDEHGHEHVHDHPHDHEGYQHSHSHSHFHSHDHEHDHPDHDHPHHHSGESHQHAHGREISLEIDIMHKNNLLAERNRGFFDAKNILAINMVSSPGSGKTTILEKTIKESVHPGNIYIIEGDQQTLLDAERIEKAGAPVVQVNTGNGCHLDAHMVGMAVKKLDVPADSLLMIENVGNLVCPALFDLGESRRVVIISVTEGEDKPLKYPNMFQTSHLCLVNKSDLLPYVDFNLEKFKEYALRINHKLEFITISAKTGEGFVQWMDWLKACRLG